MYDLDNPEKGVRECPKCRRTMQYLREYNQIRRNEGYMIDDEKDHSRTIGFWFGWVASMLYLFFRNVVQPFSAKHEGEKRQNRYALLLKRYPESLICLHCGYLWKLPPK
ncbi:MAG: hypothetical protein NT023_14205 [Armatimonadetes bacterium]|nr:hypothetical protein [Armatimonadota bacterium]